MPKKLSSAVVGTLAVGLTLPATAAAAQAVTAPIDNAPPQPLTGSGESVSAASLSAGVNISTARTAQTFSDPLAGQAYTYSTGQGPRCISLQGASTSHQGQDLLAEEGTPFSAVSDGTVVRTVDGTPSRAGFVVLRHNIGGQVYHSGYLHVWDAESHVSVGDSVQAGQTIGVVGDSGPTVAPHLHLEMWKGGWHTGTLLDPAEWLAERGVDLREGAERVQQRDVPSTCDYYTAESTPLRDSSSADAAVLTQLPRGAELTSAPGDSANGFVRVTSNEQTGWVQLGHLTPDRPSASVEPAGSESSGSAADSQGQYRVTEPLYARSGPGTNHDIRQGMPTGEQVTVTATSGDWMQFTRRGEQVWSHGAYLEGVGGSAETTESSSTSDADTAPSAPAADSEGRSGEEREVTTALHVRSGAGTSHAVVGGMPAGERVTELSTSGDWVQIRRANGQQGWAHGAYLSGGSFASSASSSSSSNSSSSNASKPDQASSTPPASGSSSSSPSSEPSSSASGTHRVTVGLNLRSGAGSSNAVVGAMPAGERVTELSTSGDWVQIRRANGQQGWAHGAYLAGGSSSSTSSNSSSGAESTEESKATGGSSSSSSSSAESGSAASGSSGSSEDARSASNEVSTNAWVNMRSGAGISHGVQRTVAPSTGLEVLGQSRGWYQVKVGDHTGWIWQDYLDVPDSAEGQPSPSEDSSSSSSDSASGSSSSASSSSSGSGGSSSSDTTSDSSETAESNGSTEQSASAEGSESSSSSSDSASGSGSSASSSSSDSGGSSSSDTTSDSSETAESNGSTEQSASAEESASSSSSGTHRATAGLNLRSGAGSSNAVVGGISAGERVTVVSTSGDWLQVRRANGQQGWAHGAYLSGGSSSDTSSSSSSGSGSSSSSSSSGSSSAPSSESSSNSGSSSSSSPSSSSSSGSSSSGTGSSSGSSSSSSNSSGSSSSSGARTTSGVNMRAGASTSHRVTRTVAGGTSVEILSQQGGWYQVRTGGNTGWIWESFLDVPGGSSSSSGSSSSGSSSGSSGSGSSSGSSTAGSPSSGSDSSDSASESTGNDSADSGGSNTGGSSSSSGRTGPRSGQHAQSSHGPYSSVWDRLAQCEATGNWSINTGNGYYGGVQFSKQSWEAVGGSGLPHQASKQEQIERAYALWKIQGWGAWPSCRSQLGLSGDPGGWGDSYFDVHGGTESASSFAAAGQWTATYSVPLREEASASSDKLVQIPRGAVLDAGERSGSWIQVQFTHDGEELTGWVNTRYVTAA